MALKKSKTVVTTMTPLLPFDMWCHILTFLKFSEEIIYLKSVSSWFKQYIVYNTLKLRAFEKYPVICENNNSIANRYIMWEKVHKIEIDFRGFYLQSLTSGVLSLMFSNNNHTTEYELGRKNLNLTIDKNFMKISRRHIAVKQMENLLELSVIGHWGITVNGTMYRQYERVCLKKNDIVSFYKTNIKFKVEDITRRKLSKKKDYLFFSEKPISFVT